MVSKKLFRVFATEPSSSGFLGGDKYSIRIFDNSTVAANKYYIKLVKEVMKEAKNTDDVLSVHLEDLKTGRDIKVRYFNK